MFQLNGLRICQPTNCMQRRLLLLFVLWYASRFPSHGLGKWFCGHARWSDCDESSCCRRCLLRRSTISERQQVPVEGIIGLDLDADLALLKIDAKKLPILEMADGALPPIGTQVFAIGNPQGLTNTLSEGLVSGHRTTENGLSQIQTTAAISPGSSGGPLLNSAAQVVGITAQYLEEGQNH